MPLTMCVVIILITATTSKKIVEITWMF